MDNPSKAQLAQELASCRQQLAELIAATANHRRAEAALRENEARYRTVVENLPQKVFVKDRNSVYLLVSGNYARDLGLPAAQVVGKCDYDFFPQDLADKYRADDVRIMSAGVTEELDETYLQEGQRRYVHTVKTPLCAEDGRVSGILGIFWDVTEHKQVEEARRAAESALRREREELARSNAELELFAYVASHDLQEPLRMVSSYVKLLAERYQGQLDAKADKYIAYAVEGATRMQTLINDLLAYSRVGTRGKPFIPVPCDRVLDQVLANLEVAVHETQAVITREPLPTLPADEMQLVQLFQNLVGNALKFRQAGQAPRIQIAVQPQGDEWVFSVQDNGIGIAPEHRDRIFVIFQRLHGREDYPGTGIGLAVCKKIAQRHRGRIWVESEPGQGSTFFVALPAEGDN